MDSEHRHELKTNELADFIGHVPQYLRDNAMMISAVILIAVAAIATRVTLSVRKQSYRDSQARVTAAIGALGRGKGQAIPDEQGTATTDGILGAIGNLEAAAAQSKDRILTAFALIKRGEGLRAELHYRAGPVAADSVAEVIAQAQTTYEQALDKAKGTTMEAQLSAMAQMGLGLCAEELGDYDKAGGIYRQIADNDQLKGTVFPVQAGLRLETMEASKGIFVFVDAPPPAPKPRDNNPALQLPDLPTPDGDSRIKIKPAKEEPKTPLAEPATIDPK